MSKITITVKIDESCEMAQVSDGTPENTMEGNFWDFHNGCHGMYHLPEFNDEEEFIEVLKNFHEKQGNEVEIIRTTYSYE